MVAQNIMVHWRKAHIKPTVFTNHLIPLYYHLIPTLYSGSSLLVTYKEVLAVAFFSTRSYFTHLPIFYYVFSFPSIFLSGYKKGFVFLALNAPRSGARHASCYVKFPNANAT